MKKLLHERLRECKRKTSYLDLSNGPGILISKQTAKELADEIERYYIPRPRFEDGEPCNVGDEVEFPQPTGTRKILSFIVGKEGFQFANTGSSGAPNSIYTGYIKRPSPKVLDADGVEIKEGDTVWSMHFPNNKRIVDHITDDGQVWFEDGHWAWDIKVTHKEPDSLEKLRDDMMEHHENWDSDPNEWLEMATRLSALIEKDAK